MELDKYHEAAMLLLYMTFYHTINFIFTVVISKSHLGSGVFVKRYDIRREKREGMGEKVGYSLLCCQDDIT